MHTLISWGCILILGACALLLILILTAKGSVTYVCTSEATFNFALADGDDGVRSPYKTCFNVEFPTTVFREGKLPGNGDPIKLIKEDPDLMKNATRSPPSDGVLITTVEDIYAAQQALTTYACFDASTSSSACNSSDPAVRARTVVGGQCGSCLGGYPCVPRMFSPKDAKDPHTLTAEERKAVVEECRSYGRFPGQMCNQHTTHTQGGCQALPDTSWNGIVCGALAGALMQTSSTPPPPQGTCKTSCCDQ
jgi:hypothetical protein